MDTILQEVCQSIVEWMPCDGRVADIALITVNYAIIFARESTISITKFVKLFVQFKISAA